MSGHSHYATIKRQKGLKDAQKGKVFSRFAREIAIAVKEGGGKDPESNYRLRFAMDKAKLANMPKENIERAISRGSGSESLEQITYEGFGPSGVAVMVETATDSRNRTAQEIKNVFERGGGSMGGPGSVAFNFDHKGLIVIKKESDSEAQMLKLIDLGVEEIEETDDAIDVYTQTEKLAAVKKELDMAGFEVVSAELVQQPKNYVAISSDSDAQKVLSFLDKLEEHDDVQKVYANVDISEDVLAKL